MLLPAWQYRGATAWTRPTTTTTTSFTQRTTKLIQGEWVKDCQIAVFCQLCTFLQPFPCSSYERVQSKTGGRNYHISPQKIRIPNTNSFSLRIFSKHSLMQHHVAVPEHSSKVKDSKLGRKISELSIGANAPRSQSQKSYSLTFYIQFDREDYGIQCSVSDPEGSGFFADQDPDFKNPDPSVVCFYLLEKYKKNLLPTNL